MATTFELAAKFQPILDEIYKLGSLTARMDAKTKPIDFGGAAEVSVFLTEMVGLGTYKRSSGYPKGDVTGTWETLELTAERGREFSIDRMDDEETLGMAFGTLVGEFMRTQVIPEVDAYRFAKYASWDGVQEVTTPTTLSTAETVLAAIDVASLALDEAEVPMEGRLLYISSTCAKLLEAALTRQWTSERSVDRRLTGLDEMSVIKVPQTRFYSEIKLNDGATTTAGGYAKAAEAADLNFVLLHPSAVLQATKHANLKIFSPDENQDKDAWKIQYRLYHDAWVYESKVDGVYVHLKAAEEAGS